MAFTILHCHYTNDVRELRCYYFNESQTYLILVMHPYQVMCIVSDYFMYTFQTTPPVETLTRHQITLEIPVISQKLSLTEAFLKHSFHSLMPHALYKNVYVH